MPSAAITLQTTLGLHADRRRVGLLPRRRGAAFDADPAGGVALLEADPVAPAVRHHDRLLRLHLAHRRPATRTTPPALCTDLHAVNTTLEADGFGPGLLCTLVPFADGAGRRVGLVYLYKQGTFYPFAPPARSSATTCWRSRCRDALAEELPMEQDLSRLARGVGGSGAVTTPEDPLATYAGKLSHDLKNPLAAIRLSLELRATSWRLDDRSCSTCWRGPTAACAGCPSRSTSLTLRAHEIGDQPESSDSLTGPDPPRMAG